VSNKKPRVQFFYTFTDTNTTPPPFRPSGRGWQMHYLTADVYKAHTRGMTRSEAREWAKERGAVAEFLGRKPTEAERAQARQGDDDEYHRCRAAALDAADELGLKATSRTTRPNYARDHKKGAAGD
jgi:hypothetical protein